MLVYITHDHWVRINNTELYMGKFCLLRICMIALAWQARKGQDQRLFNYIDDNALISQWLAPLEEGHDGDKSGKSPQFC